MEHINEIKREILPIEDFPKPGVCFRDLTPIFLNPSLFQKLINALVEHCKPLGITHVCACEARGFIIASPLALGLGAKFIPIRKPYKLPRDTITVEYERNFAMGGIEMHEDSCGKNDRVLIFDDFFATGSTLEAVCQLIEKSGAEPVECLCICELPELKGREMLEKHDRKLFTLIHFDEE